MVTVVSLFVPGKSVTLNNVTTEEAEKATDVVLGNLLVNSTPASVLFDTGASLSFVSQKFAQMHSLPLDSLPNPWEALSRQGDIPDVCTLLTILPIFWSYLSSSTPREC